MSLYRYNITPHSAWGTPMRSDTLYGQLLCACAQWYDATKVQELIQGFAQHQPPFVISSALPHGHLPMPILPGIERSRFRQLAQEHCQGNLFEALKQHKAFKKHKHLPVGQWQQWQHQLSSEALFINYLQQKVPTPTSIPASQRPRTQKHTVMHNTIHRQTQRVQAEGGLYAEEAIFHRQYVYDLYVQTAHKELFDELLTIIAQTGFGRDSSTGKGAFTFQQDTAFNADMWQSQGSHQLNLSLYCAADLQGLEGYYNLETKHGKTAAGFGYSSPFKKPFVAFQEGSVFKSLAPATPLLRHIHNHPDVVQVTWPLTLPVTLKEAA